MHLQKIKSQAKINVSLTVLGKLKSRLHNIETLISFINLHDIISIKKIKSKKHKVKFVGKFSNKIKKNNSVSNLLKILDKKNKLKSEKYLIIINKKIPQKSGMGGGSMNAAAVLKYLLCRQNLKLNSKEIIQITSKIGSDVIIGMQDRKLINYKNGKIKLINRKLKLFTLLVKPNFGCSTKKIYKGVKHFSRSVFKKNQNYNFNNNFLVNLKNDLEKPAFKNYPVLKKIKSFMETINDVFFVRMTGSGSTIIAYFKLKKAAINAEKILKKKYKNYWCILSKTI